MKKKVFYWSPHINEQIATVKAVVNSALSLIKYSKNYDPTIINVFGEFDEYKNFFRCNKIEVINLINSRILNFITNQSC